MPSLAPFWQANEIDILVSRIKTLAQKKDTTFSLTFNSYMRHTEKHLEHALDCASRAGMELSELIAPMTAQVDLASNNLFRVHLAELLRTLDEHYEALADRANEERRKGAEATEDGEVACTKAHSYAQAELLEQMTDLLDRQFEVREGSPADGQARLRGRGPPAPQPSPGTSCPNGKMGTSGKRDQAGAPCAVRALCEK